MELGPRELGRWLNIDEYLRPYAFTINERFRRFNSFRAKLTPDNNLNYATKAYEYFGIHIDRVTGVAIIREWAPAAKALYLAGDFNTWNRSSHPFQKLENGEWELILEPADPGVSQLKHLSEVKIVVETYDGTKLDRLSPWATYVEPSLLPSNTQYCQKVWHPPQSDVHIFRFPKPKRPRGLKIYECHIGIATADIHDKGSEVGTYENFAKKMLPRIIANGYNAIQIMAVMEHTYYASFGYLVTNFYAASSRYGTPEQLKALIDKAHSYGIYVILDIIHSHASKNVDDGLNEFDGTRGCFFYDDHRGYHDKWSSRIFNAENLQVLRFLISNACWWVDEYNFDGFRFDGITAILYKSRGDQGFSGHYDGYFGDEVDPNGILYVQLVNYFLHKKYPKMITIAEEVSGMPGTCRPLIEGGLGFDYRLAMAIPDKWIQLLKTQTDEQWNMGELAWTNTNRRYLEPHISYCESHDQSLVGDKTISFWLMDAKMYTSMNRAGIQDVVVDRGIALHKVIRLFTHALGGEAYMNFIGNEFGHPEWLDFPTNVNGWSYHYCRRQFNLVDNQDLLYINLNRFDQAMNGTEEKYQWLSAPPAYVSLKHEHDKLVVFERAGLVFVFNFHASNSFSDYMIGVDLPGEYQCILSSDDSDFAGHGRVDKTVHYFTSDQPYCYRKHSLKVYIPNRAAIILARTSEVAAKEERYNENICKLVSNITNYALEKTRELNITPNRDKDASSSGVGSSASISWRSLRSSNYSADYFSDILPDLAMWPVRNQQELWTAIERYQSHGSDAEEDQQMYYFEDITEDA